MWCLMMLHHGHWITYAGDHFPVRIKVSTCTVLRKFVQNEAIGELNLTIFLSQASTSLVCSAASSHEPDLHVLRVKVWLARLHSAMTQSVT